LNLLENFNAKADENEGYDSELSQKFDELQIMESVPETNIEIHKNKMETEINQINSIEELSNPTYRSAASDFESKKEVKGIPAEISPIKGKQEGSTTVSPRLIKPNPDVKMHRNLAYISTKADTKSNLIKSTNSLHNQTVNPTSIMHNIEEDRHKDNVKTSLSTNTLQTISYLSNHPSLRQPLDTHKTLLDLKERYKPKDLNGSSYLSPESLQLKNSESKIHKDDPLNISSENKSHSTELRVQQLANSNKPATLEVEGKYQSEDYRDRMKHFLRQYIDNRLPTHLKSYRSSSQIFKMRLFQRFYDTKVNDENVQTINCPSDVEHKRTYTSEGRANFYHSQMEDILKKSEQRINSFNI